MKRLLAVLVLAGASVNAQLINENESVSRQEGPALKGTSSLDKSEAHPLTTKEYNQLLQNSVVQPQPEDGTYGIGFVYQGDGEWSICDRAPEPSSLSLLLAGGAVLIGLKKRRKQNS